MQSQQNILQQVANLNAIKLQLPQMTLRGERFSDAVEAMIEVIETDVQENDIPHLYLKQEINAPDFVMNCAFAARDWMDGNYDGDLVGEFADELPRAH